MVESIPRHQMVVLQIGSASFITTARSIIKLSCKRTIYEGILEDFCLETPQRDFDFARRRSVFSPVVTLRSVGTGSNGLPYQLFRPNIDNGSATIAELTTYLLKQKDVSQIFRLAGQNLIRLK